MRGGKRLIYPPPFFPTIILQRIKLRKNQRTMTGSNKAASSKYRPYFHLSPPVGWMNDPNGLFYDSFAKLYHVYYQYNPNGTFWDQPLYWGHASSKDLLTWEHHDPALSPERDNEGIFSGSVVVDSNNTSGFFDESTPQAQRIVAIYTNNAPGLQTQEIAFSKDGGYTFGKYSGNPVLDVQSDQFRDPKVFWHATTQKWVMTLAKSQEYAIQIFTSKDLKKWHFASNFARKGLLGFQYECPGLFQIKVENPKHEDSAERWVMVLAINPGAPMGGSANQYFIGDFDGNTFTSDDEASRFMDLGNDFYAFQSFEEAQGKAIGLAWASNWQYANRVPDADGFRGFMSSVREYSLRYAKVNPECEQLILCQKPFYPKALTVKDTFSMAACSFNGTKTVSTAFQNSTGLCDIDLSFAVDTTLLNPMVDDATMELKILSDKSDEAITVGYDFSTQQFFVDRHTSSAFQHSNKFFREKWSAYIEPHKLTSDGKSEYHIYAVVDSSVLELYFNDGAYAATHTFFFAEGKPSNLELTVSSKKEVFHVSSLVVKELTP